MTFYRRRLPHTFETGRVVFLTWRLHGSLPPGRYFGAETLTSGEAFLAMDRILDAGITGPLYLRQTKIAQLVADAIRYAESELRHYVLHAFVIMPNHVHLLITPLVPLPTITKSLKGITARRANAILGLAGQAFWQEESFDRIARDGADFERMRRYIEENPVRAGLCRRAEEFPWSSAGATWGSPAGLGTRPPLDQ